MAVDNDGAAVLLPCGRDPIDVWDRAERNADDHEQTCPYCREARREHAEMAHVTRTYLDEPDDPPDGLLSRVMSAVGTGRRSGAWVDLGGRAGPVRIDSGTAETMLRWSLYEVEAVQVRRCTIVVSARPHVVDVDLGVETQVGFAIAPLLATLRTRVQTLVVTMLSLEVGRVDIEVTDLFGDPSRPQVRPRPAGVSGAAMSVMATGGDAS